MSQRAARNDPLLAPFFAADIDAEAREQILHQIVTRQAAPVIARLLHTEIVRSGGSTDPVPDLTHEAIIRLIRKLRRLIDDPEADPIARFQDYVSTVAFNVLRDHEQRADPLRRRLATRMRYVLTHTATLAIWGSDRLICGLRTWMARGDVVPVARLAPVSAATIDDARQLRKVIEDVIGASGGPVELRELVASFAQAAALPSRPFVPTTALSVRAQELDPLAPLEGRQYLSSLWREIAELPLRQRWSLLLQLRLDDGESVARMLAALGIADVRTQARALDMELDELLAIWNDLPLGDARIADTLGLTRQQVINLRKSARERLARRMGRPRGPRRSDQ